MAEKVLQHQHCRNCGKAVPLGEDYCDEDCKRERMDELLKQRNRLILMVLLGALVIFVTAILPFLGGR